MYYTQIQSNLIADSLTSGLDGLHDVHGDAGTARLPDVPHRLVPAAVVRSADAAAVAAAGARHHDPRGPGARSIEAQFAKYGLNFDMLPNYPDKLVNPRSQVASIGAEREIAKGLFVGADYVHQHWTDLARTVDLNAPSAFDRTAPGQVRSVAAANATRPILPVNGGVRQVNVLDEPRRRRLRRPADADQLSRQLEDLTPRSATRCRRRRTRPSRTATASRRTTATSRGSARRSAGRACSISAIARSITFTLSAAAQHHGRHGDAVRVGAAVQRDDRHRQQRRRREQRSSGRSTASSSASRRSAARATQDVVDLRRRAASTLGGTRAPAAPRRVQPVQPRRTSSAARRRSTATPRR